MAELIKRQDAINVLKETGIILDNDLGHLVVDEIERIPATTEAEIRAKAIDEFAEILLSKLDVKGRDWYCARKINEIAEQLKEE